jgi:hypothetical protein
MLEIVDLLRPDISEREYIDTIFSYLGTTLAGDWSLVATQWTRTTDGEIDLPATRFRKIVLVVSDERHRVPQFADRPDVFMVFKQYAPLTRSHPKVYPVPLGCAYGYQSDATIPIAQRRFAYSFSGNGHANRKAFRRAVERLPRPLKDNGYVLWTRRFGSGLSRAEYSAIMAQTKIALCPEGETSSESFRYFEALASGCVIITTPKPDVWFYRGAPHLTVTSWSRLATMIAYLLSEERLLQDLSRRAVEWWERCSPMAIARYMRHEIERCARQSA